MSLEREYVSQQTYQSYAKVYDLIIVGGMHPFLHQDRRLLITLPKGGTSGCLVASRLANTAAKPPVLLLEASGDNKHLLPQDPDRYRPVVTHPEIQHAYFTTPQEAFWRQKDAIFSWQEPGRLKSD
jgi:hypothetical protein